MLHQLNAPVLLVNGELDERCRPHVVQEVCSGGRMPSHSSVRILTLPVLTACCFSPPQHAVHCVPGPCIEHRCADPSASLRAGSGLEPQTS